MFRVATVVLLFSAAISTATLLHGLPPQKTPAAASKLPRHAIVFAHHADASRKNYDIWRVAADGSQMASVVVLPGHQTQFAVSPNGNQIVYGSRVDGKGELWLRSFNGGKARNLTRHLAHDSGPEWSPDGKRLAFFSDRDAKKPDLYVMELASGKTTRLTANELYDSDASWSPNGKRIIFTRFFPAKTGEKTGGKGVIIELDLQNKQEQKLTSMDGYCGGVDYSPRGDRIAFHRVFENRAELWVMNADGTKQRALTDTFLDEYSPAWSPDGNWIAYTAGTEHDGRGTFDLWLMRVDGTKARIVSRAPNTQMSPQWRGGDHFCR